MTGGEESDLKIEERSTPNVEGVTPRKIEGGGMTTGVGRVPSRRKNGYDNSRRNMCRVEAVESRTGKTDGIRSAERGKKGE